MIYFIFGGMQQITILFCFLFFSFSLQLYSFIFGPLSLSFKGPQISRQAGPWYLQRHDEDDSTTIPNEGLMNNIYQIISL